MSFFTIGWTAPADIGLLPQHPGDGQDPFFTIGWTVKQQVTYYPYDIAALVVGPGGGDPGAPPATGGGGAGGAGAGGAGGAGAGIVSGASGAPSPLIRPRTARAYVAARKDPGLFRRKGLTFAVALEAPATVTAVLVATSGQRKLSYAQTRKVTAGTDHITLRPSEYGKLLTRRHKRVAARLELTITYFDRAHGTVTRPVILEAPKLRRAGA